MSIQLQPQVPLVSLVKTEPPTVIKNEPPEEPLEEDISTDTKDIDFVYHPLCEDLIKSETVLENILENKHLESVQTQAVVKAENSPFIKTENITQRNKFEDTSGWNVRRGTGQGVVEVQGSNKYSNVLSNVETDAQLVLNFSKDLGISTRTRKANHPEKTNFSKDKEKMKVTKAPMVLVEAHEYTSLAKDRHICNHCQHAYKRLRILKVHIRKMHREVTTMYQCLYCPFKSKWNVQKHIIQKHKDIKDIQWFQCNLCEMKFKLKGHLTRHMKVHLKHKQMGDELDLCEKRYECGKCDYKTYRLEHLKKHNLVHLKPDEIQYFYCYHCSYKAKQKGHLKVHIFRHFKKEEVEFDCYICNFMTPRRESIIKHIKKHSKFQNKSDINKRS